ncbi:MAG: C39 family peptidase [Deltaproteobacteria bacterium]|nr:C39 family peptidase [Deltaproteobacteria bacterium]
MAIRVRRQRTPVWCWAAAVAMVVEYIQGLSVQDCEVMAEYDMRLGGQGLCCAGARECVRTGFSSEMSLLLRSFGISSEYRSAPILFSAVRDALDRGQPLIAELTNASGGHVVVVSGYTLPDQLLIVDPAIGARTMKYDEFVGGTDRLPWTGTHILTTARSPTPRCGRVREMLPDGAARTRIRCA